MCHAGKNETVEKSGHLKNAPELEKCGALGEMRLNCKKKHLILKTEAHLENCGTLGKMRHTWKSAAHLRKCGTVGKVLHT